MDHAGEPASSSREGDERRPLRGTQAVLNLGAIISVEVIPVPGGLSATAQVSGSTLPRGLHGAVSTVRP